MPGKRGWGLAGRNDWDNPKLCSRYLRCQIKEPHFYDDWQFHLVCVQLGLFFSKKSKLQSKLNKTECFLRTPLGISSGPLWADETRRVLRTHFLWSAQKDPRLVGSPYRIPHCDGRSDLTWRLWGIMATTYSNTNEWISHSSISLQLFIFWQTRISY